ncbi:hypothetical protein [Streptomyces sp. NPDC048191]|uniref:hypothetical protein n=1 Tax=Streptomyces sp. NPDC048191 TaxID=3155484 RepID=UPI0033E770AB
MKVGANSLVGNPYASEEDVEKMSWGQWAGSTAHAYTHPDYSEQSFETAWDNSKQGWKGAAHDVMTSHTIAPTGLNPADLAGELPGGEG